MEVAKRYREERRGSSEVVALLTDDIEAAKRGREGGREGGREQEGSPEAVNVALLSGGLEVMEGGEALQRASRVREWKSRRRRGRTECHERCGSPTRGKG